jgi:hypothetical protein
MDNLFYLHSLGVEPIFRSYDALSAVRYRLSCRVSLSSLMNESQFMEISTMGIKEKIS